MEERLAKLEELLVYQARELEERAGEIQELRAELESVRTIAEVALKNSGR